MVAAAVPAEISMDNRLLACMSKDYIEAEEEEEELIARASTESNIIRFHTFMDEKEDSESQGPSGSPIMDPSPIPRSRSQPPGTGEPCSDSEDDPIDSCRNTASGVRAQYTSCVDADLSRAVKGLTQQDPLERMNSWRILSQVQPNVFVSWAGKVVERLEILHIQQGLSAVAALGTLPSADPSPLIRAWVHHALMRDEITPSIATGLIQHLQKDVQTVQKSMQLWVGKGHLSRAGNSLLHLAAKAGHRELVELLIKSGSLPQARNFNGEMASELARKSGHKGLYSFLDSCLGPTAIRGGHGDALEEAIADTRRICKVEWFTIPMEGLLHKLGGNHSLLVMTVPANGQKEAGSYIVERCQLPQGITNERFSNGVFVSHWADAASIIRRGRMRHTLSGDDIASNETMPVTMEVLINLAVSMGPYDAAHCNSHQTVLKLINACATPEKKLKWMPNLHMRLAARALKRFGINPTIAEATATKNNLSRNGKMLTWRLGAETRPGDLSVHMKQTICAPINDRLALIAITLSRWVYAAMLPGQEPAVVICNESGKTFLGEVQGGETYTLQEGAQERIEISSEQESRSVNMKVLRGGSGGCMCGSAIQNRQQLHAGQRYRLVTDTEGLQFFEPYSGLPDGYTCEAVHHSEGKNIAAWSAFTSEDSVWIVFKGTQTLLDAIVDISMVQYQQADDGLEVQGGMWMSLTQRRHHTLDMINAQVSKLQTSRPELQKVFICGHSLGGAYATLAALYRLQKGLPVTQVLSFGSPQVVVPQRAHPLWQKLNALSTLYINEWDMVPRLPSCQNWLFNLLPDSLPHKLAVNIGALHIGFKGGGAAIEHFFKSKEVFADYDACGQLVFMRQGSRKVFSVDNTDEGIHWELLSTEPPEAGSFIIDNHDVFQYHCVIARLSRQCSFRA